MELGKQAAREDIVQAKITSLVGRLSIAFGVVPPVLPALNSRYTTQVSALLRNEAVADALQVIVDAVAPVETLPAVEVIAPVETPDVDDSPESLADDIDAALGGVDFIPDGGDDDAPDHIADPGKKVVAAPKPAKRKGFRR